MTHEKQILPPSPPYPAAPLGLLELLKDLNCKIDNLFFSTQVPVRLCRTMATLATLV